MRPSHIIQLALLAMIGLLFGCATVSQDLVRNGYLRLENSTHEGRVHAIGISADEEHSGLVVSGALKQYQRATRPVEAYVAVTLVGPDGAVIAEGRSKDLYVLRGRIGAGPQALEPFTVRFDSIPPKHSVLRIVVHTERHE